MTHRYYSISYDNCVLTTDLALFNFKTTPHSKNTAKGLEGSCGAHHPPFVGLFISKQPTILRW